MISLCTGGGQRIGMRRSPWRWLNVMVALPAFLEGGCNRWRGYFKRRHAPNQSFYRSKKQQQQQQQQQQEQQ